MHEACSRTSRINKAYTRSWFIYVHVTARHLFWKLSDVWNTKTGSANRRGGESERERGVAKSENGVKELWNRIERYGNTSKMEWHHVVEICCIHLLSLCLSICRWPFSLLAGIIIMIFFFVVCFARLIVILVLRHFPEAHYFCVASTRAWLENTLSFLSKSFQFFFWWILKWYEWRSCMCRRPFFSPFCFSNMHTFVEKHFHFFNGKCCEMLCLTQGRIINCQCYPYNPT